MQKSNISGLVGSKILIIFFIISFFSCKEKKQAITKKEINFYEVPAYVNDTLQMVVEIPAGTNKKIEYNTETNQFFPDSLNGKERTINFLPYPGNYGFIPSTLSDKNKGGDGDALDILVISENQKTGSISKVIPIGVLRLIDEGEEDDKIIAIPADKKLRIIDADNFEDFVLNYPEIRKIINAWFSNYNKNNDQVLVKGWYGEKTADSIIKKWLK
ncbi:inorganic diphosphatase [Mesonia sp. K7]|uniref:inorganic diphosphatase n=1 Tax=Mesonia sp. K7 TaxID=2218606 RepID=UPI000DA9B709|nr:inorganic diphosphatase [Mesonia sp. K7]PZD77589.1 inorganic diphosphatase [Mesonia sp. K7]